MFNAWLPISTVQVAELREAMAKTAMRAKDSGFWDLLPPSAKVACFQEDAK